MLLDLIWFYDTKSNCPTVSTLTCTSTLRWLNLILFQQNLSQHWGVRLWTLRPPLLPCSEGHFSHCRHHWHQRHHYSNHHLHPLNHHRHHLQQCHRHLYDQGILKKAWQHGAAHLAAFLTFFMQFSGRMFHVFKVDDDTKDKMEQFCRATKTCWWRTPLLLCSWSS